MESTKDLVIIAIIAFLFFQLPSSSSNTEEKTIYFSYCSDSKHDVYSCPEVHHLLVSKKSFKTNFERQIVVSDYILGAIARKNCEVFDKDNWYCDKAMMINGKYTDRTLPDDSIDKDGQKSYIPFYNQIDWFRYYVLYLKGLLLIK